MYRKTDNRKVWYEWMVEVFALEPTSSSAARLSTPAMSGARSVSSGVDNLKKDSSQRQPGNGATRVGYRRVRVGLSDMHSSIKDGCLM